METLNCCDYVIAMTTDTKPPVLQDCEETCLSCPKEKPHSRRQLHTERLAYGGIQEGSHLQALDGDPAQIHP